MKFYLFNIRTYVLVFTFLLSIGVYFWVKAVIPQSNLQTIRLQQVYALLSVTYLYFALLAGPICYLWTFLPFRAQYLKARRSLGLSAFYFGLLHSTIVFFGQLGGLSGLAFLTNTYIVAVVFGFGTLVIMALMASTSSDWAVAKLGFFKWKLLHRMVYLAGILILVHALMLGTHFSNLSETIPQIFLTALAILLFFEANRIDAFFQKRWPSSPKAGVFLTLSIGLAMFYFLASFISPEATVPLGIHSQHIQIAKEAQKGPGDLSLVNPSLAKLPGLQGDRTRRFTVSFDYPDKVITQKEAALLFKVYDASSGSPVQIFSNVYSKTMHLIIVDESLTHFLHIHPEQTAKGFEISTGFPHDGIYHLYVDFQPLGAIEQQFAFTLSVGDLSLPNALDEHQQEQVPEADWAATKIFGDYEVGLSHPQPLLAKKLSIGEQKVTFIIKNKSTGQLVTDLKPYLASFGHLVMINQKTFDYLHVHPTNLVAPKPDQNGGPNVEFMPIGLYGPIKPGIYRLFAQFNPAGVLLTTDFTVEVR